MTRLLMALFFVAAVLGMASGCAPQRVTCPGWAMPFRVDQEASSSGAAGVTVTPIAATPKGEGSASFTGRSSLDFSCKHPCPKGTLLKYARTAQGAETLECLAGPAVKP